MPLKIALVLFLYYLPSFLAFNRAQKKFWIVLGLNTVLTFVQAVIFQKLFPDLFVVRPGNVTDLLVITLLANFGPGWLALVIWSLLPGEQDPRLLKFKQTKFYAPSRPKADPVVSMACCSFGRSRGAKRRSPRRHRQPHPRGSCPLGGRLF